MTVSSAAPSRGIVLIGMRGVGKTTVGTLLAHRMGIEFIDLDALVLSRLGATSVRAVFEHSAERGWRAAEASALTAFMTDCRGSPATARILAVGGGAPSDAGCFELLQNAKADGWRIVQITADPSVLAARLHANMGDRAALTNLGLLEELTRLTAERQLFYDELSGEKVDGSADPASVVESILRFAAR
ncbi:MAG: AAA family ATPase [Phycisphaerales bacterium]|nr:AAA family ATPase [Phycisphaerales bacterium]